MATQPEMAKISQKEIDEAIAESERKRKETEQNLDKHYIQNNPRARIFMVTIRPVGKEWVADPGTIPDVVPGDLISWGPILTKVNIIFPHIDLFGVKEMTVDPGEWRTLEVAAGAPQGPNPYMIWAYANQGSSVKGDDGEDPTIIIAE